MDLALLFIPSTMPLVILNLAITWVFPSRNFGVIDISTDFYHTAICHNQISSKHLWKIVKIFCVEKQGFIILEIGMQSTPTSMQICSDGKNCLVMSMNAQKS